MSFRECSLCYESSEFMARGVCGHEEVCWLCTLRLRWICKDNACAICKTELDTIELVGGSFEITQRINGVGVGNFLMQKIAPLIEFHCPYCPAFHFRSLGDLQTHLKRDHSLLYCSVCLDHRQCFLPEQELFDSSLLSVHMQKSHPSCLFCRGEHFYSSDELLVHMHQAHFKCVVCERLDFKNEYYAHCQALSDHSAESHFPCLVPECLEQHFVVFADEDELGLHMAERHGGRVALGRRSGAKRQPNRHPQDVSVVHFRGPKIPSNIRPPIPPDRYPDLVQGASYDKNLHKAVNVAPVAKKKSVKKSANIDSFESKISHFSLLSTAEKQAANVALLAALQSHLSASELAQLKQRSNAFRTGNIDVKTFVIEQKKLDPELFVKLVGLMPDANKRAEIVAFMHHDRVPMPSTIWEGKRPCLIHALNALLESGPLVKLDQTTLHAMENKINGLDRIQLSTLSELRDHLMCLSTTDASWASADDLVSLRPLLYRLLHVPDTHRARASELIALGWTQFVEGAQRVLGKFSNAERGWLKAYMSLCALRLCTIGPLDARRRTDFPDMKSSSVYFPAVSRPSPPVVVPTRADFPASLVAQNDSRRPVAAWQNSTLREAAFPQLESSAVVSERPKNWTCTRCTFVNTHMLALACEICAMERPAPGAEPEQPAPTNPLRSKKSKHKVILSSSTQRDYKR